MEIQIVTKSSQDVNRCDPLLRSTTLVILNIKVMISISVTRHISHATCVNLMTYTDLEVLGCHSIHISSLPGSVGCFFNRSTDT